MHRLSLSVVLPTYNCRSLLSRHLDAMEGWVDLADEVVVVDSKSTDGTLELIRARLHHPNMRIIIRDHGLYASWNEGIAVTTGSWIYVSTVGDTIDRAQLLHLRDLGERAGADVVVSPPRFVDEHGAPIPDLRWPPHRIVAEQAGARPFLLSPTALAALACLHCPACILGSSASNLYSGDSLRAHPFPTDFHGGGDTVWLMRESLTLRVCLTPRIGSVFCVHHKAETLTPEAEADLQVRLWTERQALARRTHETAPGQGWSSLLEVLELHGKTRALLRQRRAQRATGSGGAWSLAKWLWLTAAYGWHRLRLSRRRRAILRVIFGSRPDGKTHWNPVP